MNTKQIDKNKTRLFSLGIFFILGTSKGRETEILLVRKIRFLLC